MKRAAAGFVSVLFLLVLNSWLQAAEPPAASSKSPPGNGPRIVLNQPAEKGAAAFFEVLGLSTDQLARLRKADLKPEQWTALFAVRPGSPEEKGVADRPAMLGTYELVEGKVRFVPRFPLSPGVHYQAIFDVRRIPGEPESKAERIITEFHVPKRETKPTTVVEQIYPSKDVLPENQLKFYILFSAPMSRGEAYDHVELLDARGKPIKLAFLEVGEELWDPPGKRFTLFFDPGRIKRGLKPREDLGPALEEGKSYTLVISKEWQDAEGNPLKESFRKGFRVIAPDDAPIDEKTWKLQPPRADGRAALRVQFPESLDFALLHRMIWVVDESGKVLPGSVKVSDHETRWEFTPEEPWQAGSYALMADTALEDLGGNKIGRPFEVDEFKPIQRKLETKTVRVPFRVSK